MMNARINVMLVHGAWADGSSWSKVIPLLEDKGFNVTAPQIPLTSIADDVAVTKRLLAAQKGDTILVGHSYGGIVISGAAQGAANVKALVYVAGWGNDEGESIEDLSKQGPAPAGAAQVRPDGDGFLWIAREGFAQAFAADVDPTDARVMAVVQKPLSIAAFAGKPGTPGWKNIPSWYMVATNDQMIPPAAEEFMAKRMGATIVKVPGSHAVLVSHPKEVVDLIAQAAESIVKGVRKTA
jgi:pimeloyl-ACP methyl ester carboxylesterase